MNREVLKKHWLCVLITTGDERAATGDKKEEDLCEKMSKSTSSKM